MRLILYNQHRITNETTNTDYNKVNGDDKTCVYELINLINKKALKL